MFIFVYFFTQTDPTRTVQRSAFCRSWRELSNADIFAKFGFDTAENEKIVRSTAAAAAENEPFKVR